MGAEIDLAELTDWREIDTPDEGYRQLGFAVLYTALKDYVRGELCGEQPAYRRCVTKHTLEPEKNHHFCAGKAYDWLRSADAALLMQLLDLDRQAFLEQAEQRAREYQALKGTPHLVEWVSKHFPEGIT